MTKCQLVSLKLKHGIECLESGLKKKFSMEFDPFFPKMESEKIFRNNYLLESRVLIVYIKYFNYH